MAIDFISFINLIRFLNFIEVLAFIQTQGYIVLLILMVIEGPVVTTAAAFAASFGYFNIFIVLLLSILGDLIGDLIYFEIGRGARKPLVEKYLAKLKIKRDSLDGIEEGLRKHFIKSMIFVKFTPFLSSIGLMTAGVLRINRKKFISTCLLITIPRALFFTIVGYYLGVLINPVLKYYNLTGYLIIVIIIVAIVSYVIYKKLFERLELTYKVKKAFFLLL